MMKCKIEKERAQSRHESEGREERWNATERVLRKEDESHGSRKGESEVMERKRMREREKDNDVERRSCGDVTE